MTNRFIAGIRPCFSLSLLLLPLGACKKGHRPEGDRVRQSRRPSSPTFATRRR